jgi:hypothetical protein
MSAGVALFAAVASAEVLVRVVFLDDLSASGERVLLLLAVSGLAASCVVFASLLVSKPLTRAFGVLRRSS